MARSRKRVLKRKKSVEEKMVALYRATIFSFEERSRASTLGAFLIGRARVGEAFLLLASVIEEEGLFDFKELKELVGENESERTET